MFHRNKKMIQALTINFSKKTIFIHTLTITIKRVSVTIIYLAC